MGMQSATFICSEIIFGFVEVLKDSKFGFFFAEGGTQ